MADDEFVEPRWRLALDDSPLPENGFTPTKLDQTNGFDTGNKSEATPSTALLPVKSTYVADLVKNDRVTAEDHFQDVRLMDLRIPEAVPYGPGAVAVIYPKNFPENVQEFIDLMSWHDIADKPIQLISSSSSTSNSPSPLRHLDLTQTQLTLRWLLENALDIMSIPRRTFFASLAYFAAETTEDEKYQKERLLELANPRTHRRALGLHHPPQTHHRRGDVRLHHPPPTLAPRPLRPPHHARPPIQHRQRRPSTSRPSIPKPPHQNRAPRRHRQPAQPDNQIPPPPRRLHALHRHPPAGPTTHSRPATRLS